MSYTAKITIYHCRCYPLFTLDRSIANPVQSQNQVVGDLQPVAKLLETELYNPLGSVLNPD